MEGVGPLEGDKQMQMKALQKHFRNIEILERQREEECWGEKYG